MIFKIGTKRNNELVSFKNILPDIITDINLEKSFTIEGIRSLWPQIVSDIISTHSIPDRIFNDILFISVDHSIYANEISMMKNAILEKINETISYTNIKDMKVEIKKLNWKR